MCTNGLVRTLATLTFATASISYSSRTIAELKSGHQHYYKSDILTIVCVYITLLINHIPHLRFFGEQKELSKQTNFITFYLQKF